MYKYIYKIKLRRIQQQCCMNDVVQQQQQRFIFKISHWHRHMVAVAVARFSIETVLLKIETTTKAHFTT